MIGMNASPAYAWLARCRLVCFCGERVRPSRQRAQRTGKGTPNARLLPNLELTATALEQPSALTCGEDR